MKSMQEVTDAILQEIAYQNAKWGEDKEQSLPGYLTVMRNELRKAEAGWCKNSTGRDSCLSEILQCVTVGVRALMEYGVMGTAHATSDIPLTFDREGREIGFSLSDFGIDADCKDMAASATISAQDAKYSYQAADLARDVAEAHAALSPPRPTKVVELTLPSGGKIYIARAVFLRAYPDVCGTTVVVTYNGSVEVKESLAVVQAKFQD